MCHYYFNDKNFYKNRFNNDEYIKNKTTTIVDTTSSITSSLTEKIELHNTYYLEESYVSESQLIKEGEPLLKYTNETYLLAPYECIITSINIPKGNEQCNNHYIEISSNNILQVQIKVSENKIDLLSIGQEVKIIIPALNNKEYEGIITDISSTANNGSFTVTIEFENDGELYIGMSAEIKVGKE